MTTEPDTDLDDTAPPPETAEPAPTNPPTTEAAPPTSPTTTGPEAQTQELTPAAASMSELLDSIPLQAYETARADDRTVQIDLIDFTAVAEATGLDRPDPNDFDASLDWVIQVGNPPAVSQGGTGFAVAFPQFVPDRNTIANSEDVKAELGFSIHDIDQAATLFAPPWSVAVLSGENLTLSSDLTAIDEEIVSAGDGADFEMNVNSRTDNRPLGRPLRFATTDTTVAASLSTPLVQAWLDGDPGMAEQPQFAAAAEALDTAGVASAFLIQSDFAGLFDGIDVADAVAYSAPFSVVGIGVTVMNGRAANAIVYVFDDEATAAQVAPELERAWTDGQLVGINQAVSDLFEVRTVTQRGTTVTITATVTDESTTNRALEILFRGDPIFSNS